MRKLKTKLNIIFLSTVLTIILPFFCVAQSDYDRGFSKGFEEGYCFNSNTGCVSPPSPPSPAPSPYEDLSSYKDGYNRGFQSGLSTKKSGNDSNRFKFTETPVVDNAIYNKFKNYNDIYQLAEKIKDLKRIILKKLNDENYYGAIKLAELGLKINPKDSEFPLVLGQAYLGLNNTRESLKWYKRAQRRRYRKAVKDVIRKIERGVYNEKKSKQNNFESYTTTFDNPIVKKKLYSEPNIASDVIYECPKDSAILLIEKVDDIFFKAEVDGYTGYIAKSFINLDNNQTEKNKAKGKKDNSKKSDLYDLLVKGEYKKLIEVIDNRTKNRRYSELYGFRGIANYNLKNYKNAIKDITMCAENINDIPSKYLFYRALSKGMIGDYYGSLSDYNLWLDNDDDKLQSKAIVYNNIAYSYVNLSEYTKALPMVNKALKIDKKKWFIWDTRAEIYLNLNEFKLAIEDASKAININPNSNSFYLRGMAYINENKIEKGCIDLSRSGELGNAEAYSSIKIFCNK